MDQVVEMAVQDANQLTETGFPALMIENFGDTPFYADSAPPETIAAMTVAVAAVGATTHGTIGVNVLRNDVLAALGIAAVTGASTCQGERPHRNDVHRSRPNRRQSNGGASQTILFGSSGRNMGRRDGETCCCTTWDRRQAGSQ